MTTPPAATAHTPAYEPVTLSDCDTEPIHVPGAIQPHGVLLALDADLRVVMTSENTGPMIGVPYDWALDTDLGDLVGADVAAIVARRVREDFPSDPLVVLLGPTVRGALAGVEVDVRVHGSGGRVVVELEAVSGGAATSTSYRTARTAMGRLARTGSIQELTTLLAGEVRQLTGFDRVMVYRFDEHWNGEVVAEVRRPDLNSFLGLHYPASDIPAQARRLYEINPIRLIADVGYTPVPLSPVVDPATGTSLDLSFSTLRSVSPIHLEYLSNMGVTASMSVSIMIDEQLWGLIACHHYSGAHRPSQDARAASEFVTQVAAHQIAHRERADARDAALATRAELTALTSRLTAKEGDPLDALFADPSLLTMVGATGAAQFFDGVLRTMGDVPSLETLQQIADVLNVRDRYLTHTSHLAELDPELAAVADIASGVLRVGTLGDRWGLWFRPEQRQVVDWGGDPTNKRLYDAEDPSVRLSPRKSFDRWREVMHGHSEPWQPWQAEAADELGRHINSLLLLRSREQIAMAESMQRNVVLDRAPGFDGVELVARYRPASSYQLGGDWWDAFELPDGRLVFVVGDVAGHGVAAASAMTQVRAALRAYLFEGHSPAQCLDHLDRLMEGLLDFGVATAIVAVLDRATGRVEIANAGHPAPLLVGDAGGAVELEMDVRPLLGVGQGEAPTIEIDLPVGDLLVLFTDGLVERRGTDLSESTERLRQLAGDRPAGDDAEAWADRILGIRDTTTDDTTLLAVRRLA